MIPKIIHYCWFGRNPLPALTLKCIESWNTHLPDYEIIEWNEDNFDVNQFSLPKMHTTQKNMHLFRMFVDFTFYPNTGVFI